MSPVDWALAYAAHGLDVFPCTADKHPLTPNGYLDATRDPAIIKARWERWPFAEPALAVPPNIVVADLDRKNGRTDFAISSASMDATRVASRRRLQPRPAVGCISISAASKPYANKVALDGTGIDTRSHGGSVVLPAAGNGRQWLLRLSTTPLQPAPDWLDGAAKREPLGLFLRPAPASPSDGGLFGRTLLERAVRLIMTAPQGAQEETRHRQAYFIGTMITAGAVDYDVAYRALIAAANAMPAYGKPWRNLEAKIAASLARGMEHGP